MVGTEKLMAGAFESHHHHLGRVRLFLVVLRFLVLLLRLDLRWRREGFDNRRVDLLDGAATA